MPYGGNDWLSLTPEMAVEPDLPICDPHHHLWDKRYERIPYQRYLIEDLLSDINSGHNIKSTVFIEAESMLRTDGPDELKPVGEVEFVQGIAAASASGIYGTAKIAAGIVGSANLNLGDKVKPVLEKLQQASPNRFRGIRHRVTWDPHGDLPGVSSKNEKEQLLSDNFRIGARILADMNLSLEGWMFFHQLPELADFAKSVPKLTIVLNHIGGLIGIGPYSNLEDVIPIWKKGISLVAACPNIVIKLGGMGMEMQGFGWHSRRTPISSDDLASQMAPYIEYCIEQFGPNRCMFESNFPVDKVSYSYVVMYNAFKKLSRSYSHSERAAMFHDNATETYRID